MKISMYFTSYIKESLSWQSQPYFGISIMRQRIDRVKLSLYLFLSYEYILKLSEYMEIINTVIEACNFYLLQGNVSSLRPTLASSLVILQPLLMLRGVQHLTTSGLLQALMNLTISVQRRKIYMYI